MVEVIVALIGTVGLVMVARVNNRVRHVQRTVGVKNGNGDLAQMQARLLGWHVESDRRLGRIEDSIDTLGEHVREVDAYTHDTARGVSAAITALDRKIDLLPQR